MRREKVESGGGKAGKLTVAWRQVCGSNPVVAGQRGGGSQIMSRRDGDSAAEKQPIKPIWR